MSVLKFSDRKELQRFFFRNYAVFLMIFEHKSGLWHGRKDTLRDWVLAKVNFIEEWVLISEAKFLIKKSVYVISVEPLLGFVFISKLLW